MPGPLTGVTGIYFDLDDTLCTYWAAAKNGLRDAYHQHAPESAEELIAHWAAAFRELLPNIQSEEWYGRYLKSGDEPRTEVIRRSFHRLGITDEDIIRKVSESYKTLRNHKLELFPDAIEVLTQLKARFPLGLITNGPADIQRMEIDRVQIESYFDEIFIEGELGFGKPDQRVFERAAHAMGKPAHELLFVGNSYNHDIEPAIRAGWKTVWVCRKLDVPPTSAAYIQAVPNGMPAPGAIIEQLAELPPLL